MCQLAFLDDLGLPFTLKGVAFWYHEGRGVVDDDGIFRRRDERDGHEESRAWAAAAHHHTVECLHSDVVVAVNKCGWHAGLQEVSVVLFLLFLEMFLHLFQVWLDYLVEIDLKLSRSRGGLIPGYSGVILLREHPVAESTDTGGRVHFDTLYQLHVDSTNRRWTVQVV